MLTRPSNCHPGKTIQHAGRNEKEDLNPKFQDQQQADEDPYYSIDVGMANGHTRRKDHILTKIQRKVEDHPDDGGSDKVKDVLEGGVAMCLFDQRPPDEDIKEAG